MMILLTYEIQVNATLTREYERMRSSILLLREQTAELVVFVDLEAVINHKISDSLNWYYIAIKTSSN